LGNDVPIVVLFRYPTIRSLASYMVGEHSASSLDLPARRGESRKNFARGRSVSGSRHSSHDI
jgi:hypothetical protein